MQRTGGFNRGPPSRDSSMMGGAQSLPNPSQSASDFDQIIDQENELLRRKI